MKHILFVHGGNVNADTWNLTIGHNQFPAGTALGGKIWHQISQELNTLGYHTLCPTLSDEYHHNLSDHVHQISQLIISNQLSEVTLVAHSYGGMVITGVANKLPSSIKQLVYIDAALPNPDQSLFDLLQSAGLNPADMIEGQPQAYTEKCHFSPHKLDSIKKAYLLCTDSLFISVCQIAKQTIHASSSLWTYQELNASHLPMATHPHDITQFLLSLDTKQ